MNEKEKEILLAELAGKLDDMQEILFTLNDYLREREPMLAYALNPRIVRTQNQIRLLKEAMIASFRNEGMPSPDRVRKIF